MLRIAVVLGLGLAIVAGCADTRDFGKPKKRTRGGRSSYKSKTPEEWLQQLRGKSHQGREQAVDALLQYGPKYVPGVIEVVEDRSLSAARLAAVRLLGAYGTKAKAAVPALVEALQDRKFSGRDGAAMALGKIRDEKAVPALITALRSDPDERVRAAAAGAMGHIRTENSEAISALVKGLDDSAINVRAESAESLEKIGPAAKAALPALQKATRSQDFVVSQAATEAIKSIRGQ